MSRSRIRERGEPLQEVLFEQEDQLGQTWEIPYDGAGFSERMADIVTPRFNLKISQGEIINNECGYTRSERICENNGSAFFQRNGSPYWFDQWGAVTQHWLETSTPVFDRSQVDIDELVRTAKLGALSYMDRTPYAFGEDIGEIRETIRFLRSPLSALRDVSEKFRGLKTQYSKSMPLAEAIAKAWLAYRFAAAPLVRSVSDLLEATQNQETTRPTRLNSHSRRTDESQKSENVSGGNAVFSISDEHRVKVHAAILYEVSNPHLDWQFHYGLRAKDLPLTIWQLMPYSFMVDRVVDVSRMVSAVRALSDPTLAIKAASVTIKDDYVKTSQFIDEVGTLFTSTVSGNVVIDKSFSYTRHTWIPQIQDAVPPVKPAGLVEDLTKITDLVAIILANFR